MQPRFLYSPDPGERFIGTITRTDDGLETAAWDVWLNDDRNLYRLVKRGIRGRERRTNGRGLLDRDLWAQVERLLRKAIDPSVSPNAA